MLTLAAMVVSATEVFNVYANSSLFEAVEKNFLNLPEPSNLPKSQIKVPYVFVADDALRLTTRFMKPFGQKRDLLYKIFNYRLSRARRVVENAFGILANRFQVTVFINNYF